MGRKSKAKAKISKEMNLGELVQTYPKLAEALAEDYGLHCVGCFAAGFDSLEQGARVHGYDDKEIGKMVKRLNKLVSA